MREELVHHLKPFEDFPDDTRLWVYGFEAALDDPMKNKVVDQLRRFLPTWAAHGMPVDGAYSMLHDRFVFLAGRCSDGISGCSIDSSVKSFKELKKKYDIDALNRSLVFFRTADGTIESLGRVEFQAEVDAGRITDTTVVFDPTIQTLGDLREGRFDTTFGDCWHARVFHTRKRTA